MGNPFVVEMERGWSPRTTARTAEAGIAALDAQLALAPMSVEKRLLRHPAEQARQCQVRGLWSRLVSHEMHSSPPAKRGPQSINDYNPIGRARRPMPIQ
jgi:hypothetical protein